MAATKFRYPYEIWESIPKEKYRPVVIAIHHTGMEKSPVFVKKLLNVLHNKKISRVDIYATKDIDPDRNEYLKKILPELDFLIYDTGYPMWRSGEKPVKAARSARGFIDIETEKLTGRKCDYQILVVGPHSSTFERSMAEGFTFAMTEQ